MQTMTGAPPQQTSSEPVAKAVIGMCPSYNGRIYSPLQGSYWVISCGQVYNGTIISTSARRALLARVTSQDSTKQCEAMSGCVEYSYTDD